MSWFNLAPLFFIVIGSSVTKSMDAELFPTNSSAEDLTEKANEQLSTLAKEMGIPVWAVYCIGIGKKWQLFS